MGIGSRAKKLPLLVRLLGVAALALVGVVSIRSVVARSPRVTLRAIELPRPISPDTAELTAPAPDAAAANAELDELVRLAGERTEARKAEAIFWHASAVVRWNEIARELVSRYNTSPPVASRLYALLSVAQHDALVAAIRAQRVHGREPPSHADSRVAPLFDAEVDSSYPSDHAAVAGASAAVIGFVYANKAQNEWLNQKAAAHEESRVLAGVSYRSDVVAGDALGREVAAKVIAKAKTDLANKAGVNWRGDIPQGKDKWASSERPPVVPLRAKWGEVRPWLMTSGSQLRAGPPPSIDSPEFATALEEVRQISRTRSPEQLRIAQLWADGQGSATPPGHWNQIAADLLLAHPSSQLAAARVMAYLNMAVMDAGIACWDTKYFYWFLRPTQADPTITVPVGLPNFPSYPSGHSTFSAAAADVLAHFFPSEATRVVAMAEEASRSRVYGGIHYSFDGKVGLEMGRSVAKLAIDKERVERDGLELPFP